jgi:hypothetical protein
LLVGLQLASDSPVNLSRVALHCRKSLRPIELELMVDENVVAS